MNKKILIVVLIILNVMVLMGQVYPEGAPPFAKTVNILFLVSSLGYFVYTLMRGNKQCK